MTEIEGVGDNIEFVSDQAGDEITIYFQNNEGNTSANDTTTAKYFNTNKRRSKFFLRTENNIEILGENGETFTSPVTVVDDKGHKESFSPPGILRMKIRCPTANTNIKLRVI